MGNIAAERLSEGEQILVRGRISFSRLASVIDGPALQKSIEQATKRGALYPTKKPHTTVSLVDAQVLPFNPSAPTLEEQFVHEKTYIVKSGENQGKTGFNIDNVSTYLPTILEQDPDNPGQYRQLVLERDLASGLDVTLVIQVFKPQGFEKRGLGLQQVVLNEPVKYYASGMDTSALAARGIVVNGPIRTVSTADAPAVDPIEAAAAFESEAARAGFPAPANTGVSAQGLPMPLPGAQGTAPAPQQFPVVQQAPAAQQFPVQQAPAAAAPAQFAQDTPEQQIARLQQQMAERDAAAAQSGGASAFDGFAAPAPAPAGDLSPWQVPGQGPAAFQG